jgi:hypothetical protein
VIRNKSHLLVAIASLVMTGGCFNPDRAEITRAGSLSRVVEDSPEVERLLSIEKIRDAEVDQFRRKIPSREEAIKRGEDMMMNPERYAPGRKEFIFAMSQQPGVSVPGNTYVRSLATSGVKCNPNPIDSGIYIKVRITSGPFLGYEGWACQDNIGGTFAMP